MFDARKLIPPESPMPQPGAGGQPPAPVSRGFECGGARIPIGAEPDMIAARHRGRQLALRLGFAPAEATLIVSAIAELAWNVMIYAGRGSLTLLPVERCGRIGLAVTARDEGPGIGEVRLALQDGYSTAHRLGLGLPGVRRVMDEFDIASSPQGTTVCVVKWL